LAASYASDGQYFKIHSYLKGHRVIGRKEIHSTGQRVYLKDNDKNDSKTKGNQWWVLDKRTKSIRAASDRNRALSNLEGKGNKYAGTMVARTWKSQTNQQIDFYPGKKQQLKIEGACIDVYGNRDRDGEKIILWKCHNGDNQAWLISGFGGDFNAADKAKDTEAKEFAEKEKKRVAEDKKIAEAKRPKV